MSHCPGPVPVALALLRQHWPAAPAPGAPSAALAALEQNPRCLIGRLQQALLALLETDLPPMDPLTSLLSRALADAVAWREHQGPAVR